MTYRSDWNIILGPPGTGKTTFGIKLIEEKLTNLVEPQKLCFLTFTRKAIQEIKTRVNKQFEFETNDLHYFRTIHSFCFSELKVSHHALMQKEHWDEFSEMTGIEIDPDFEMNSEIFINQVSIGSKLLSLENLSRVTEKSLEQVFLEAENPELSFSMLVQFSESLKQYKELRKVLDFTDLLIKFLKLKHLPKFELLFVDEAQDLSFLQWQVIHKLAENAKIIYAAGDDDQGIYSWSGADIKSFINLQGKRVVLDHSYRLPKDIYSFAIEILQRMDQKNRIEKKFFATKESGFISFEGDISYLDLEKGTWLLLARNNYLLKGYEKLCEEAGFPFESPLRKPLKSSALIAIKNWTRLAKGELITGSELKNIQRFHGFKFSPIDPDRLYLLSELPVIYDHWYNCFKYINSELREYFLAAKRQDESLFNPRIIINSIHGSKGAEADYVAVLSDVSRKVFENIQDNPDDEHRVFYTAVTRAKKGLHIILPRTKYFYDF